MLTLMDNMTVPKRSKDDVTKFYVSILLVVELYLQIGVVMAMKPKTLIHEIGRTGDMDVGR